jgi:hypothetical protein
MSVGVMKDYKLKQRNLRASHTLGWSHLNSRSAISVLRDDIHARNRFFFNSPQIGSLAG